VSTLDFRQCWVEEVLIVARRNKVVVQMIQNSNTYKLALQELTGI
jgi:hypothetical protein